MPKDIKVRIRMLRVGLGDCFLLTFLPAKRSKKPLANVLIDCGVDVGTPGGAARIRNFADAIVKEVGPNLDLLIATHEHWDHVSGFSQAQAQAQFDSMNIRNVWLAWTEDPNDTFARDLKAETLLALQGLTLSAVELQSNAAFWVRERVGLQDTGEGLAGILSLYGVEDLGASKFSKKTDEAMDWVSSKKKDKKKSCH